MKPEQSLVERLRQANDWKLAVATGGLLEEAADRIEELERQLQEATEREAKDYSELLDAFNDAKVQNVRLLTLAAERQLAAPAELPPLPPMKLTIADEPGRGHYYSAEQMQEYARAAQRAELPPLTDEQIERLFYKEIDCEGGWALYEVSPGEIIRFARALLAQRAAPTAQPEMLVMNEQGFEWPIERRDDGKWQFVPNAMGAAPTSQGSGKDAEEAEHFIQAAIDSAPEPLRRLGRYLASVLDEDQWATAERMLLGAAAAPQDVPADEQIIDHIKHVMGWREFEGYLLHLGQSPVSGSFKAVLSKADAVELFRALLAQRAAPPAQSGKDAPQPKENE